MQLKHLKSKQDKKKLTFHEEFFSSDVVYESNDRRPAPLHNGIDPFASTHVESQCKRVLNLKCNACDQYFLNSYSYENHQVWHDKYTNPHPCELCGQLFRGSKQLSDHYATRDEKCPICCDIFSDGCDLHNHMLWHSETSYIKFNENFILSGEKKKRENFSSKDSGVEFYLNNFRDNSLTLQSEKYHLSNFFRFKDYQKSLSTQSAVESNPSPAKKMKAE